MSICWCLAEGYRNGEQHHHMSPFGLGRTLHILRVCTVVVRLCTLKDVCTVVVCLLCTLKDYCLVSVNADTAEYKDVATRFFETMTDLRAHILHIHRLHNPVLWQFYTVYGSTFSFCSF